VKVNDFNGFVRITMQYSWYAGAGGHSGSGTCLNTVSQDPIWGELKLMPAGGLQESIGWTHDVYVSPGTLIYPAGYNDNAGFVYGEGSYTFLQRYQVALL
jgi:hypothetical protein